jgi:hypothetical protein
VWLKSADVLLGLNGFFNRFLLFVEKTL